MGFIATMFTCSVVSNVVAGYLLFYLKSVTRPDCQLQLCKNLEWALSFMYRVFLLGCLTFQMAVARSGWNYFPAETYRWIPFAVAIPCIITAFVTLWGIGQTQGKMFRGCETDYYEMPETSSHSRLTQEEPTEVDGYINAAFGSAISTRITRADPLSERCMLIPYFAGYALTTYKRNADQVGTDWEMLRAAYISSAALSTCLPILGCMLVTSDLLFCWRLYNPNHQRLWSTARLAAFVWGCGKWCYYIGVAAFYFTMATVGWGTGFRTVRLIPAYWSFGGLFLVLVVLVYQGTMVTLIKRRLKRGRDFYLQADPEGEASLILDNGQGDTEFDADAKGLAWVSIMGIVTSGYVFYAICAAQKQLGDQINKPGSGTSESDYMQYVSANSISFTASITTAVLPTMFFVVKTEGYQHKKLLGRYLKPVTFASVWVYRVGMLGILAAYSTFGTLKFGNYKTGVPLLICSIGLLFVVIGEVYAWLVARRINNQHRTTVSDVSLSFSVSGDANTNMLNNASYHESMLQKMDVTSRRALFFGGISYFSTDFINPASIGVGSGGYVFLTVISVTFASAVTIISYNVTFRRHCFRTWTRAQKDQFAHGVRWMVFFSMGLFMNGALCFFIGVAWLGKVKVYGADNSLKLAKTYGPFFFVGGWVAVVGVLVNFFYLPSALFQVRKHHETLPNNFPRIPNLSFPVETMLGEIGACAMCAAFVAGNVFYELLLVNPLGPRWSVYTYWTWCFITLCCGGWVVVTMVFFMACLSALPTEKMKQQFCRVCYDSQRLAEVVFLLFNVMWFSWLIAEIFVGFARGFKTIDDRPCLKPGSISNQIIDYCEDCTWLPAIPASLGLVICGFVWYKFRKIWWEQYDIQAFSDSTIDFQPQQFITPPKSWQCL
eukprot:TRINITY_DN65916_c0_g1_i1.p1 TRINITY_DN65916_c0_g1~~TRINITY_DN65916_c0_g1_i1.p1  ORF type:complete len:889 (-),score=13.83 TRINITY_DN65916_c0_g1_i1:482-3148(-)